jgi:hypothetical protein
MSNPTVAMAPRGSACSVVSYGRLGAPLLRILREYGAYYNADRPRMSLDGDAPMRRAVQLPATGGVVALPRLGGLHHRYTRVAA